MLLRGRILPQLRLLDRRLTNGSWSAYPRRRFTQQNGQRHHHSNCQHIFYVDELKERILLIVRINGPENASYHARKEQEDVPEAAKQVRHPYTSFLWLL